MVWPAHHIRGKPILAERSRDSRRVLRPRKRESSGMGDDRARRVAELVDRYGRMVFTTAHRIVGNADDAADVTQDVFLTLLDGWNDRLRPDSVRDWGAYLRVAASRRALLLLRRKPICGTDRAGLTREIAAPSKHNPCHLAEQRQQAEQLREAIASLPDRDASVFALRYLEGFSYQEIATEMDVTVNQVGVILHRSRRRLREILDSAGCQGGSAEGKGHV